MKVWLDGKLLDASQARVSPLDRGFLYGDGLFETLRAYRGKPFLLAEHLERLEEAAREVGIPAPPRALWEDAVRQVLAANALVDQDARVRLTLTRGAAEGALWPAEPGTPTMLATAQPVALPGWLEGGGGASVVTSAHRVLSGRAARKSTSFQSHVLAKREAHRAGAWEALLLNERGEVAEGATSNVFALLDGALVTPPPQAGILEGLTRAVVLRLAAPGLCLEAREASLGLEQLAHAREVFLTSSVAEVVPVVRLDGQALGDAHPGPVTRAVRAAYRAEVARVLGM